MQKRKWIHTYLYCRSLTDALRSRLNLNAVFFFLFLNNLCIFITKPCLILYQNLCLGIIFIVKLFSLCCLFSVFILTSHDTLTAQCLTSFDYLHTTATEVNTNANCFFFFFYCITSPHFIKLQQ